MNQQSAALQPPEINRLILFLRDQRVILDRDLARVYGVETRVLNQAAKRNPGSLSRGICVRNHAGGDSEHITNCDILAESPVLRKNFTP